MSTRTESARPAGRAALAVAVLGALAMATPAWSNGPGVGLDAGSIYPVDNRAIQLVSEVVDIRLDPPDSGPGPRNALCVYRLRNLTDSTQRFTMAFVANQPLPPVNAGDWGALYRGFGLEAWQDGVARPVTLYPSRAGVFREEYGAAADSFPAWDLTIGPRRTSTVRMRYRTEWNGGCDGVSCGQAYTYYALPAARWAGRIERASIQLHLGDSTLVRKLQRVGAPWSVTISPRGYRWTPDGLQWEFSDWEPDANFRVEVSWPAREDDPNPPPGPWTPDSLRAIPVRHAGRAR